MGSRAPPFIGRKEELVRLRSLAEQVAAGRPRIVLLDGPAGIGKTRLVPELTTGLPAFSVQQAYADETEAELPYALAEQLLPEGPGGVRLGDASCDPFAVGATILHRLTDLPGSSALLLVVEDLQWADHLSAHALVFALRRLRADRVLAVLTTRTEEAPRVPRAIWRLREAGRARHLTLGGLTANETVDFVAALGGPPLVARQAERLTEQTGGSPLWIAALVAEQPAELLGAPATSAAAPRAVVEVFRSRLLAGSRSAQRLVSAASVLGGQPSLAMVASLAGVASPDTALDEAERLGLLVRHGTSPVVHVGFPHAVVGAAIHDALDSVARAELHRRAAELTGDTAGRLRHQVAASPAVNPQLSARLCSYARELLARGAGQAAATIFVAAARLAGPGKSRPLLLEAAHSWLRVAEAGEAALVLRQLEVASVQDARHAFLAGWVAALSGRADQARQLLEEAWQAASSDELRPEIARVLAQLELAGNDGMAAAAWGQRAADTASDELVRASGLAIAALGQAIVGRTREALALLAWLPDGDEVGPHIADCLVARSIVRMYADDLVAARADLSRVIASPQRAPQGHVAALGNLALTHFRAGRWDDSVLAAERSVRDAEDMELTWQLAPTRAIASHLQSARGQWSQAERHIAAASQAADTTGDLHGRAWAQDASVRLAHHRGDAAGVLEAAAPLLGTPQPGAIFEPGIFGWRGPHSEALVRLERFEEAETALRSYEATASQRGRHSSMAEAARARGLLEEARGDRERAEHAYASAVEHAEAVAMPFPRAMGQLALGSLLRRGGRRRAAAELLGAAEQTFHRLQATPYQARADRELRGCGLTLARGKRAEPVALTPQELTVARLVAGGRSNREVASELVISVKTVEFHLGHIYTKLGVHSRTQMSRRLTDGAVGIS